MYSVIKHFVIQWIAVHVKIWSYHCVNELVKRIQYYLIHIFPHLGMLTSSHEKQTQSSYYSRHLMVDKVPWQEGKLDRMNGWLYITEFTPSYDHPLTYLNKEDEGARIIVAPWKVECSFSCAALRRSKYYLVHFREYIFNITLNEVDSGSMNRMLAR